MRYGVFPLMMAMAAAAAAPSAGANEQRPPLLLVIDDRSDPEACLVIASLGGLAKDHGVDLEAYLASAHGDGGIFSPYGSSLIGGRHELAIAQALGAFATTVIRIGDNTVFGSATHASAVHELRARDVIDACAQVCRLEGWAFPATAVEVQMRGLPAQLAHATPYLFPEIVYRHAIAVPLESPASAIAGLARRGVRRAEIIGQKGAAGEGSGQSGIAAEPALTYEAGATLYAVTRQIAQRWIGRAAAVDLLEPVEAPYWLPFSIREDRLQVCSLPTIAAALAELPELLRAKADPVIYARYDGGEAKGVGDSGWYGLFRGGYPLEVIEPNRPVLTVFSRHPVPLAQAAVSPFDLEPGDAQLRAWAQAHKILVSWLLHSGELSHDDGVPNFIEASTRTGVPIGMGVHWQRYAFEPWSIEPIQVPRSEGGALGLVEPILHSTGAGILAERVADPQEVARRMRRSRDRIAALAGERFTPRGVYCYQDADPADWNSKDPALWRAIQGQGFEYVISSVANGPNRVLYRDGDFTVINMVGQRSQYSPFVSFRDGEPARLEQTLAAQHRPGWLLAVLDVPIYAYQPYLATGHIWGNNVRIADLYDYVTRGARERDLVPATPHVIVRYARLLQDMGLLPAD